MNKKLHRKILTIMKDISAILWCIHQLPQNILGVFLRAWYETDLTQHVEIDEEYHSKVTGKWYKYIFVPSLRERSFSMGQFIFVGYYDDKSKLEYEILHEYGHTLQSKKLGWLYLPYVFVRIIPANIGRSIWNISDKEYYSIFCEKWADLLGQVNTSLRYKED